MDAILINAARDLRTKADRVVRAFNRRITNIDEECRRLESELTEVKVIWKIRLNYVFITNKLSLSIFLFQCLKRLADTEMLIENLMENMRNMDTPMKLAQTRLDNRNRRLNVENCRDRPHVGLIEEVRSIEEATLAISVSIREHEDTKSALAQTRVLLERELLLKRRALQLDKERCLFYRSHYPSATALSGYVWKGRHSRIILSHCCSELN